MATHKPRDLPLPGSGGARQLHQPLAGKQGEQEPAPSLRHQPTCLATASTPSSECVVPLCCSSCVHHGVPTWCPVCTSLPIVPCRPAHYPVSVLSLSRFSSVKRDEAAVVCSRLCASPHALAWFALHQKCIPCLLWSLVLTTVCCATRFALARKPIIMIMTVTNNDNYYNRPEE